VSADALERQRGPVTYELATWGVRAVALLIDGLILSAVIGVAFGVAFAIDPDTDAPRRLLDEVLVTVGMPIGLLYAPLLLMRGGERNGQTLGKQVMRIRVVRENGEPVTLGTGIVRETLGRQLLAAVTRGFYLIADYAWPLWDESRQCLHDKIAKTRVVRVRPVAGRPEPAFTFEQQGADAPTHGGHVSPAPDPEPAAAPEPEPVAPAPPEHAPAPPPAPRDDSPVRDGWLPPHADR